MNDDLHEAQRKSDRPAPSTSGISRPAVPPRPIVDEPEWGVDSAPRVAPAPVAPAPGAPAPVAPAPVAPAPAGPSFPGAAGSFGYESRAADLDPQFDDLDERDDEGYEDEGREDLPPTLTDRIRGLKPAPVILGIGSIGSVVFLLRAMTSHTTPVPVLLSAGVVAALVFGIDAGVAAVAVFRSGQEGRTGRALLLALLGGFSALVGAGAFSGVLVMVLVLNS